MARTGGRWGRWGLHLGAVAVLCGVAAPAARAQDLDAPAAPARAAGPDLRDELERNDACDAGDGAACAGLGEALAAAPGAAGRARALAVFRRGCQLRDGFSCVRLGDYYAQGEPGPHGVRRDPARALQLYLRGCRADVPIGCLSAASAYDDARDMRRAVPLYRRACAGHLPEACLRLASAFRAGRGVPRDDAAAALAYACFAGLDAECLEGGALYQTLGNPAGAAQLFGEACENGVAEGCTRRDALAAGAPPAGATTPP